MEVRPISVAWGVAQSNYSEYMFDCPKHLYGVYYTVLLAASTSSDNINYYGMFYTYA